MSTQTQAGNPNDPAVRALVRPVVKTGPAFWGWLALLVVILAWFVVSWARQLTVGHVLSGQGTRGAVWGITVANIVHLIGISHVGIAISAVVRIMRLERYRQLARLAEFVTLASLATAVLNIGLDVGRPDRFIVNVFWYGRWHSPFVWSMTVITTYFVGSTVYLYLAMRRDIACMATVFPKRAGFYRALSLGYRDTPSERERNERTVWWLAVIILPIMVSVHSVYGLIFGMQAARPGWFNPLQAPYFVLGAIVSGFSAMIIVAAVVRRLFGWQEQLPPRMFKGLGIFLGFVTLLYMYFFFTEQLTASYAAPAREGEVANELLTGQFAGLFWPVAVIGLVIPFWALFVQGVNKNVISIRLTVTCAVLINVAMWMKRFFIVVPSFMHPHLPIRVVHYQPTAHEWGLVLASYAFAALIYTALIKTIPSLELPESLPVGATARATDGLWLASSTRRLLLALTPLVGIGLIALGIAYRQLVPASAVWVTGIVLLLTIPLQICLPTGRPTAKPAEVAEGVTAPARETA
ncbi:MAG TPA: NrfD/PsrC family molybdoenzyme membrane anchor subunit [Anaeromyxobacter sp.]